jgi:alkylhydroperoxidase family enzyme
MYGRILARQPEVAERWRAVSELLRFGGSLPAELKEAVRQTTAGRVGCQFCASVGAELPRPDARTALAVAVAAQVAEQRELDDSTFTVLREEFSEDEIVELLALISFVCIGAQTFGHLIGVEPATDAEREAYNESINGRLAALSA